jgi:CheY-like chemotaxis protein
MCHAVDLAAAMTLDPSSSESPAILLVEDDEALRYAFARTLRGAGFRVLEAADTMAAIGILEGAAPVDLLVTDVVMPGRPHGFALARMARLQRPGLKIVYLTGATDLPESELRAADGPVLQKPVAAEVLVAQIAAMLGSGGAAPD